MQHIDNAYEHQYIKEHVIVKALNFIQVMTSQNSFHYTFQNSE